MKLDKNWTIGLEGLENGEIVLWIGEGETGVALQDAGE